MFILSLTVAFSTPGAQEEEEEEEVVGVQQIQHCNKSMMRHCSEKLLSNTS